MVDRTKIVDIELSRPLEGLNGLEGYRTLKALVRLHGTPIGYATLSIIEGRCTAKVLGKAILDQHSSTILRHLVRNGLSKPIPSGGLQVADLVNLPPAVYSGPYPLVTVAVCTRDRTADLRICLEALSQLDYAALNIIVVDNAPTTDATKRLVAKAFPNMRYVCEPRPGLNWARNRAISEACGEIIAYTDDDVVVDPGWISAIARSFTENPEVMAITGLVVPYELETEAQLLFEQYGGFGKGFERTWYQVDCAVQKKVALAHGWAGKFGTGANMAYRRCLFGKVGVFDPALDVGTATNGGGDIEMFFRVLKNGHTLLYEPCAIVRHRHRRDYASLRRQIKNHGIGFSAYLVRSALAYRDERFGFFVLALSWFRWWHVYRLRRSLKRIESFPRDLILAELWGSFIGFRRYQKARRAARRIERSFAPVTPDVPAVELSQ